LCSYIPLHNNKHLSYYCIPTRMYTRVLWSFRHVRTRWKLKM
jgi:hypothetical protein